MTCPTACPWAPHPDNPAFERCGIQVCSDRSTEAEGEVMGERHGRPETASKARRSAVSASGGGSGVNDMGCDSRGTAMKCKWDSAAGDYLTDVAGEPCRTDEEGDPTRHCTARRTCSVHIGPAELTCPRCIARVRANVRRIPALAALMLPVAITTGVNSEAANLAAPATDPAGWTERRIAMRSHLAAWEHGGRITEEQHLHARSMMEDDDEDHPLNVLGRWCLMISEDYGHDLPARLTVSNAADYLDRQLARIANDDEQDFALLGTEIRKCRKHLDAVLAVSVRKERGAPCPDCGTEGKAAPRMVREYGHYCDDPECERINFETDEADFWVCPNDRKHTRTVSEYDNYLADRKGA